MAWSVLQKPTTLKVTKAIAREFSLMDEVPGDRALSEARLNAYRRMLNEGTFRPVTWAKCYCKETESTYRINGKHTSTLLSSLEVIPEFYATIEHYTADTMEDISRLYATYDSKLQSRTNFDINRAFASNIPEYANISMRLINTVISGIGYAKWQEGYWRKTAMERAEVILDEVEFVLWVASIMGSPYTNKAEHMERAPVIAAMYFTWNKSHRDATTFWTAVRDETGDKPGMPDRVLARFLLSTGVDRGTSTQDKKKRGADRRTFLVKCIHAWNAWRRNQTTDLKYHPDAKVPAAV